MLFKQVCDLNKFYLAAINSYSQTLCCKKNKKLNLNNKVKKGSIAKFSS